jgi:hypothetical protein
MKVAPNPPQSGGIASLNYRSSILSSLPRSFRETSAGFCQHGLATPGMRGWMPEIGWQEIGAA